MAHGIVISQQAQSACAARSHLPLSVAINNYCRQTVTCVSITYRKYYREEKLEVSVLWKGASDDFGLSLLGWGLWALAIQALN